MKLYCLILSVCLAMFTQAQQANRSKLAPLPPMGWILNKSGILQSYSFAGGTMGLPSGFAVRDCWQQRIVGKKDKWTGSIQPHETKLFRLIKKQQ